MPSPRPADQVETRYGWSNNRAKNFHRVVPRTRGYWSGWRFKCDSGAYRIDQTSSDRHSVPAHLRPCPRCFREAA